MICNGPLACVEFCSLDGGFHCPPSPCGVLGPCSPRGTLAEGGALSCFIYLITQLHTAQTPGFAGGMSGYHMKLVLLGNAGVGKSCLVLRFVRDIYLEDNETTIGAAFLTKSIALDDA